MDDSTITDIDPAPCRLHLVDRFKPVGIYIRMPIKLKCFFCRDNSPVSNYLLADVEDRGSGTEIVGMLYQRAILEPHTGGPTGWQIKIGACDKHMPQLRKLNGITSQTKTITPNDIFRARYAQTPAEFHRLIEAAAFLIWKENAGIRDGRNWTDAVTELTQELGRAPNNEEAIRRAHQLWERRRPGQALEDWAKAERSTGNCLDIAF